MSILKRIILLLFFVMMLSSIILTSCGDGSQAHTHEYNLKIITGEYLKSSADCNNAATYYYSCTCGEKGSNTFTDGESIPHNEGDWIVDSNPTVSETGKKHTECTRCHAKLKEEIIPATGSVGLNYLVNDDGKSCTITDIGLCGDISIFIPSVIDGYTVTKIGSRAFYGMIPIIAVTIPDSVEVIESQAFAGCTVLRVVTMSDNVKSIGSSAFEKCSYLRSITIPDSVTSISNYAFSGCSGLTSITIGNGVTSIGEYAFSGCSGLTSITIPDSVTSIGNSAFSGCSGLESITLPFVGATLNGTSNTHFGYIFGASSRYYNDFYVPSSLKTVVITGGTSIGEYAFYSCDGLTSITIGNGVTSIGNYAFYGCDRLTSITIGNGVTSIGECAFYECDGLTSITIPDSVTSIGNSAFRYCSELTSINYCGTEAQWRGISKGYAWNSNTGNYSITFNYKE